jgi:hypothetical protein
LKLAPTQVGAAAVAFVLLELELVVAFVLLELELVFAFVLLELELVLLAVKCWTLSATAETPAAAAGLGLSGRTSEAWAGEGVRPRDEPSDAAEPEEDFTYGTMAKRVLNISLPS